MPVTEHSASVVAPVVTGNNATWMIFCTAVDNFGDIGVCWRLARQLVREHDLPVTLYIDDWDKALSFLGRQDARLLAETREQGVRLCHWCDAVDWQSAVSGAALVIEAFGCTLPEGVIAGMAAMGAVSAPPRWVNLEYLSAESWIEDYHGQLSLQTVTHPDLPSAATTLCKTFFFPGFTSGTGGLLREHDLLEAHKSWQADQAGTRAGLLQALGINKEWHEDALLISLFAYPRPPGNVALKSWFAAMAEDSQPVLCLVPVGAVLADVADALGQMQILAVGEVATLGSLSVAAIPFLPLDDYDRLLSVCDLNLVRGEDSFVRAQWAGRPLIWHIYPQQDDAHLVKLDAFLARYGEDSWSARSADKLVRFNRFWNLDADCGKLWHDLRPQLPDLTYRARNWQQKLAELPDLASSLMQFYRNRP
ncbi:hypothetical protein LCGC14_0139210 [marine sediment metagenome]|uniref:Elongation factor P maturation arginine rhamnosyltransferase EarP n=2 Tax=root TaxID=1 RepID=A0A0F9Y354_9ZZZZ|nr:elongation factor P maturation arginine rhamnosyltransferase EarP [Pseudohongiella sp.]HEA64009.1 elongation factor P maturation arginine rhamnosyltransferase EarP [Pseudohongiella sp.]